MRSPIIIQKAGRVPFPADLYVPAAARSARFDGLAESEALNVSRPASAVRGMVERENARREESGQPARWYVVSPIDKTHARVFRVDESMARKLHAENPGALIGPEPKASKTA